MSTIAKPAVHSIAILQLALLLLMGVAVAPFGAELAGSVWAGGLIHLIPPAWFAHMAYRHIGARQVRQIVWGFYWGQAGKLMLTAALVVATIKLPFRANFLVVFTTFIAMVPIYFLMATKVLYKAQ